MRERVLTMLLAALLEMEESFLLRHCAILPLLPGIRNHMERTGDFCELQSFPFQCIFLLEIQNSRKNS